MRPNFFTFVALQYVHDAISKETVNVGLVAFWPATCELKFKVRTSMGRVRQLFPDADRHSFITSLRFIRRALLGVQKAASTEGMFAGETDALRLATKAVAADDSAFQWSSLGRGFASEPQLEFDLLYERLVARYDAEARSNRSDEAVWRPVRELLNARELDIEFEEKSVQGETDQVTFDNAWKNGAWHAYQAVSLDLSTPENILDKARRWRGQMAGVADGATAGGNEIKVNFLLGRPQDPNLFEAYEQAIAIFSRLPMAPRIYPEEQLIEMVDEIEREYRRHNHH